MMMLLIALRRGLVHRAGSAAMILVVAVVVVVAAAAAAVPVYYQAAQQSILAGALSSAPFIGRASEVTLSASMSGTLPSAGPVAALLGAAAGLVIIVAVLSSVTISRASGLICAGRRCRDSGG